MSRVGVERHELPVRVDAGVGAARAANGPDAGVEGGDSAEERLLDRADGLLRRPAVECRAVVSHLEQHAARLGFVHVAVS